MLFLRSFFIVLTVLQSIWAIPKLCRTEPKPFVWCHVDYDGNGTFDEKDIDHVRNVMLAKEPQKSDYTYDINGSGSLTAMDMALMRKYERGLSENIGTCECLLHETYGPDHICLNAKPDNARATHFSDNGRGVQENPYRIYNAQQLASIAKDSSAWNKYFLQCADIDFSDYYSKSQPYFLIGSQKNPFEGVYDGQKKTIKHFTYQTMGEAYASSVKASSHVGLFSVLGGQSLIKNVTLDHPILDTRHPVVGTLVGEMRDESQIYNVRVTEGTVVGHSSVGGLIGVASGGVVSNVEAETTIKGLYGVGGLIGSAERTLILHSKTKGRIEPFQRENTNLFVVGGFLGFSSGNVSVMFSEADMDVNANENQVVGGFVGFVSEQSSFEDSYAKSRVTGGKISGGFAGTFGSSCRFNRIYSSGDVLGKGESGGLIGRLFDENVMTSKISTDSFSASRVEGASTGYLFGSLEVPAAVNLKTLHFWKDAVCKGTCTKMGREEVTKEYFYSPKNAPLSNWLFSPLTWQAIENDFPVIPYAGSVF